jgi:hypothetical protein
MENEISKSDVASQNASEKETETKSAKPATKIETVDLPNLAGVELDYRILNAIPEHSKLEKLALEKSIVENGGCADPVKVGKRADGRVFLVDGLFGIRTCLKHGLQLPQGEFVQGLQSRQDAINYRIDLHLNRRNMTPRWTAYLWGKRYNELKKPAHRPTSPDAGKSSTKVPQNEGDTSKQLASKAGVGHATIDRFSQYANAIDSISASVDRDFARTLLNGKMRLSKNDTIELSKMSNEDIKAIVKLLKEDPKLNLKEAIQNIRPSPADPDQALERLNHKLAGIWTALQDIKQVGDPERLHTLIKTLEDLLRRVKEIQINSSSH